MIVAAIDDKMSELGFSARSSQTVEQITQLITDAADIASASGGKITITQTAPGKFTGVLRNFVRVKHGVFTLSVTKAAEGDRQRVQFKVDDYLRVRDTVLAFIPVSPWQAPAYRPLRKFTTYLREKL